MAFITEWLMPTGNFTLPFKTGFTYNCIVDWGDGSPTSEVTAYNDADATHNYTVAGTYQISITGTCGAFSINNGAGTKLKLKKVIDWGNVGFTGLGLQTAFRGCANLNELPTGSITGANAVTNISLMFSGCTGLTSLPDNLLDNLTLVTDASNTFYQCSGLTTLPADLFRFNTSITTFSNAFYGCTGLTSLPAGLFQYNTLLSNASYLFYGCTGLTSLPADLFQYNTAITTFSNAFYGCNHLTALPVDLFRYNTLTTLFDSVFRNCLLITALPVDLFRYNTEVTSFSYSFAGCTGLTSLPAGLFQYNTKTNTCQYAFNGCTGLTSLPAGLFQYNTALVVLSGTFYGCTGLTSLPADLLQFNINVTAADGLFYGCIGLTTLPVDLFRYATKINTFESAFYGCIGLTALPVDLFRYNTLLSTVYPLNTTFKGCTGLTALPVDLFRYNTTVTRFNETFSGCTNLVNIPDDLFKYNTNALEFNSTFLGCTKLKLNKNLFFADGEESTRFLNKSVNFTNCFYRTSFTGTEQGTAPALWNCNYGTGTPTKTNCFATTGNNVTSISNYAEIPRAWGAIPPTLLNNLTTVRLNDNTEKLTLTAFRDTIPAENEIINCYFSTTLAGLVNPVNLVPLTKVNYQLYEADLTPLLDNQTYYVRIEAVYNGSTLFESKDLTGLHYQIAQKETTVINITDPNNYIKFTTPLQDHSYNHGSIFYNGYIYGSARSYGFNEQTFGSQIFKIQADNYGNVQQKFIYYIDETSTYQIKSLEQIVICSGFLWVQAYINLLDLGLLIRIDPSDLSYMIFNVHELDTYGSNFGQPIGTDGQNLFVSSGTQVHKLNTSLLISSPATYGYSGNGPIELPANTIIGSCNIQQLHPSANTETYNFETAYIHSILIDDNFIFIANTTSNNINGYDSGLDLSFFNIQKINKTTMQHLGIQTIPKCTDDMVDNANYLFLVPEYVNTNENIIGNSWGLVAINKTDLSIKYLKALAAEFNTVNEADRSGFGVFVFDDKITVQLIASKKTVVIRLDDVESWGADFPIGGATEAIYKFQINGVDLAVPCNELVVDDQGWVHTNTWEINTTVFKFPTGNIIPPVYNVLSLFNDSAAAVLSEINENYGCSIRCVQDAPGVADGVTGTATDQDGNTYNTVVINQKRWFVENLKTTHYRDGSPIANITANTPWSEDTDGAYCSFENI